MQSILYNLKLNQSLTLLGVQIPVFGLGLLLGIWVILCAWWGWRHVRRYGFDGELQGQLMFEALVALVIWRLPSFFPEISIKGYGMAMGCGFLCASWLASERAKRERMDPKIIWDAGMIVLLSGLIGARLFFVIKNPSFFFGGGRTLGEVLFQILDISSGGLVLYGGVLLGIAAYIGYCRYAKVSALKLADILIPSIFVGEMFGRIGCFLNGCCYGDVTTLPWAVRFPPGSVPFKAQFDAKVILETAQCSLPLHPTQIYSSLCALVLAIITWNYFPRRSRDGGVLLLGWLLYPIVRFGLEIVRGDTPGEFGTSWTIAQWVSLAMLLGAIGFGIFLSMQPRLPPRLPPDVVHPPLPEK